MGTGDYEAADLAVLPRKYYQERGREVNAIEDTDLAFLDISDAGRELDLAAVERLEDAHLLLARLSGRQRAVLVLHLLEGLPFAEVGERIGVSEGAARGLYHRARSKLRNIEM